MARDTTEILKYWALRAVRAGLSWQIVPRILSEIMSDSDREKVERAMAAIMKIKKMDIQELEAAAAMG